VEGGFIGPEILPMPHDFSFIVDGIPNDIDEVREGFTKAKNSNYFSQKYFIF
jgi:hypothetical protein